MPWHAPHQIGRLLCNTTNEGVEFPPNNGTVYVLTRTRRFAQQEHGLPNVLYVGGRRAENRFRIRIGDLIADMLGFFYEHRPTRHCAGREVRDWCRSHGIDPSRLYLWWKTGGCPRCGEITAFDDLHPKLNNRRPPRCDQHHRHALWHPDDC